MSNYQAAFNFAFEELRACDVETVIRNANAEYSAAKRQFSVPFFQEPYLVSLASGKVVAAKDGQHCDWDTGIMILNYLTFAKDVVPSNRFISLKEVPGGINFFPAFQKAVLTPLIKTFENDLPAFTRCAELLGGKKINLGHSAAKFEVFPKVPLAAVLWAGDEEINGASSILFDSTVEYFSPTETIIGYGYYVSRKLLAYYGSNKNF
ncbi:MAG: DUF3786 domain-containing protein [Sporomusaceae bacterium]|jgi:hypothetical protein|nr:DUF3786 domain-containing protein [Sporomusaceae bacterium]